MIRKSKILLKLLHFVFNQWDKNDRTGVSLMTHICTLYEDKFKSNYCAYKLYPRYSSSYVGSNIKTNIKDGEIAIVFQGPIRNEDDFTIETIRLYKKMYPYARIIVSTWNTMDKEILQVISKEGCSIVLSDTFAGCGLGNVNYQICTSLAGIKKAKELGCTYTLRIRSDIRLYREFLLPFLKNILQDYPISNTNLLNQKGRIITQSGNWGQMFIPDWLQDFWYFGYTEDLYNLFNIPYDKRNAPRPIEYYEAQTKSGVTGEDLYIYGAAETYIVQSYLRKYNIETDSVQKFHQNIKDYFITVDQEMVLSYWPKYNLHFLSSYYCEYDGAHNFKDAYRHVGFVDSVNMMHDTYLHASWMEEIKKDYRIK